MEVFSRIKQYYRYRRNWKKFRTRRLGADSEHRFAEQLNFYSQFIKEGDLCFDIGANVGDKTEVFLCAGARVVAVEPQESCWRVLRRRFKGNNVYVEPYAVSDSRGERTLFVDRSPTISSMSEDWIEAVKESGRFSTHKWGYKLSVPTTTLDALVAKYGRPVFCKIDVEGAELKVLQGLSQPVGAISFEFVSERMEPSLSCIDYLCGLGRAQFNYYLGEAKCFALPDWVGADEMKAVLAAMDRDIGNFGDVYVRFADG